MEVLHLPVDQKDFWERRQQLALGRSLLGVGYEDMAALITERAGALLPALLLADMERGYIPTPSNVTTANLQVINETLAALEQRVREIRAERRESRWPLDQQGAR